MTIIQATIKTIEIFLQLFMAKAIIQEAMLRVKKNVLDIESGEFGTTDSLIHKIADRIIESKGYFAAHPLTKTFW